MTGDTTLTLFDATMRVCGADLQGRINALINFRQILYYKTLAYDEFRSLMENNPYLIGLISEHLNYSVPEVRKAAHAGELVPRTITLVLHTNARIITANSEAVPISFEEAVAQGMDDVGRGQGFIASLARRTEAAKLWKRLNEILDGGI